MMLVRRNLLIGPADQQVGYHRVSGRDRAGGIVVIVGE